MFQRSIEDGDYLKVQYVAWTIPDKTIFSSSFHTGSLPVKIVLGGKDEIAGVSLSQGLRGACRGERRNVFVPASHASSSSPLKRISDLKFSIEVVKSVVAVPEKVSVVCNMAIDLWRSLPPVFYCIYTYKSCLRLMFSVGSRNRFEGLNLNLIYISLIHCRRTLYC